MLKIRSKVRKTRFLTPSGLRCLSGLPTVNISAGCAHGCVYCYTKGYSIYPGADVIELYEDLPGRIAEEIFRKRKKPAAVYFCPSCDPFQPVEQGQRTSYEVMKVLLQQGIGVQFVTKGIISKAALDLFEKHPNLVFGQIGITSVDDKVRQIFEPDTATVDEKLSQLKRLVKIGVKMCVRCDPLIHSLTDDDKSLELLFGAVAQTGCRQAAVSYLFLRPAIAKSLRDNIKDTQILFIILEPYRYGVHLPVGMKSSQGIMLPIDIRKSRFKRIITIAGAHGINARICGCKNSDITDETCNITRQWPEPISLFE